MTRLSFRFALFALCLSTHAFAATLAVTSIDDSIAPADGNVTLREAITSINAGNDLGDSDIAAQNPGVYGTDDTIDFNIAGAGVHAITLGANLPNINKTVFINGYSQPGASPNTNALNAGINATLRIEIAAAPGGPVFNILADGTEFRGLAVHGGSTLVEASNVVIAGNFFDTDASGATILTGSAYCIQVSSFGSTIVSNVIIGGPAAADRNLIAASSIGVQLPFIAPGPGTGYVIQGNYIGTDVTGTVALGGGLGMDAITNALVSGNLISGNPSGAISQLLDNNTVQGNLIGTQRDGTSPLPNGGDGINISTGGNSTIGGAGAGEANVIANNAGGGVVIYTGGTAGGSNVATRNRISHNSIYANGSLGISLDDSSFVLANDAGDGDSFAADRVGNDGQNYPVITSAAVSAGNATVAGTLNSIASSAFTLEFFANAACDASGYGEGRTFIGATTVTTDGSGDADFGPLSFPVPAGQTVIAATATDAAGNTSEFSQCPTGSSGANPTTTAIVSSRNPSTSGESVTFTATVTGSSPTGSVQFMDGSANLAAPVALIGAVASLATSALSIGTHPITAVYSGDTDNLASTSPLLNQVVNAGVPTPTPTTTVLISSRNPSILGQAITFSATVNGANPTGNVQFNDGAAMLANVTLNGHVASFTTSALALGSHPITAIYGGDAANSASASPVLIQVVTAVVVGSPPLPTPTLSPWMLLALAGLIMGAAGWIYRRRA